MICKKCQATGTVLLRQKDSYCNDCFMLNTNHKFRACLGKNRTLSPNERVLVCLSGGIGSTVLLDMVHNGISLETHKKLRVVPLFLHIVDTHDVKNVNEIGNQCKKYHFDIHVVPICDFIKADYILPTLNGNPTIDVKIQEEFNELIKNMSPTTINDYLAKVKRSLYITCAKVLKCNFIFTGETTTKLAVNLLTNLAGGRGSQIEHDIGFSDNRNEDIKLLKPMKDISQEELNNYVQIKNLKPVYEYQIHNNSLQSVIQDFVINLQENFQATVSTVCKTADKIGVHNKKEGKCVHCESDLYKKSSKLTALEATNISSAISYGKIKHGISNSYNSINIIEDIANNKLALSISNKNLCYGCSRNILDMEPSKLPSHVQNLKGNIS